jgi:hypothetical protein
MDVVVFGATGKIGRTIVEELVARDHQVTGVTRSGTATGALPESVELLSGDMTDPGRVSEVARGRRA